MPLLILADDLTGTGDCGARCVASGLPASLFLKPPVLPLPQGAVAFTSDSRYLSAQAAKKKVADLVKPLAQIPGLHWYKKIDSTLRGNIGSELEAMFEELGAEGQVNRAIICPAFPQQGRGLENGYLCADGVLPRSMYLPDLLAEQTELPVSAIKLEKVRAGQESLSVGMAAAEKAGAQLLVIDALTDEDLRIIVQAAATVVPGCLFCGSAGFVGILAGEYAGIHGRTRQEVEIRARPGSPVLGVIGSGSQMAHQQIQAVKPADNIAVFEVSEELDCLSLQSELRRNRSSCLLHLPRPAEQTPLEGSRARCLANRLVDAALVAITELHPKTIILSGGDTAISVLNKLSIDRLQVLAELMPGIPLTKPSGSDHYPGMVILKPGSFGREHTLLELFNMVHAAEAV